jgi:hypothetical protein
VHAEGAGYKNGGGWHEGFFETVWRGAIVEVDQDTAHAWMWVMGHLMGHPLQWHDVGMVWKL